MCNNQQKKSSDNAICPKQFPVTFSTPQPYLGNRIETKLDLKEKESKNAVKHPDISACEVYEVQKKILISDFEKSIHLIKEEENLNVLIKGLDYQSRYESAIEIRTELEKTLQNELSNFQLIEKGKFLKKELGSFKKWTLVLEIQGVLQYISGIPIKDFDMCIPSFKNDNFLYNMYVKNRKDIGEFLFTMKKYFEVIIFSELFDNSLFTLTKTLEEILHIQFDYVIGSSHSFYKNSSIIVKNINCLLEDRKIENIIIVDYNLNNSCFYLDQTILVPRFRGQYEKEDFLKHLTKFLLMKTGEADEFT